MILFVDDEKRRMSSYVGELELAGYDVHFERDVDLALAFFNEHAAQVELLVLDIMMPTGDRFTEARTGYGLRTGIAFYEEVAKTKPSLPTVIFTNVSDESSIKQLSKTGSVWFFKKDSFVPFQLKEKIDSILKSIKAPA